MNLFLLMIFFQFQVCMCVCDCGIIKIYYIFMDKLKWIPSKLQMCTSFVWQNNFFLDFIFHFVHRSTTYLILILCSFSLKPRHSLKTPDNADNITTLIVVYKYGFALRPDILNGDSNSCRRKEHEQILELIFTNNLVFFALNMFEIKECKA